MGSPIQISKPVLSVHGAEVIAQQDALVASIGSEELRCMHLSDVCLVNHNALRRCRTLPCGLAAPARSLAACAAHINHAGYIPAHQLSARGDLGCINLGRNGEVVVVLLTC